VAGDESARGRQRPKAFRAEFQNPTMKLDPPASRETWKPWARRSKDSHSTIACVKETKG